MIHLGLTDVLALQKEAPKPTREASALAAPAREDKQSFESLIRKPANTSSANQGESATQNNLAKASTSTRETVNTSSVVATSEVSIGRSSTSQLAADDGVIAEALNLLNDLLGLEEGGLPALFNQAISVLSQPVSELTNPAAQAMINTEEGGEQVTLASALQKQVDTALSEINQTITTATQEGTVAPSSEKAPIETIASALQKVIGIPNKANVEGVQLQPENISQLTTEERTSILELAKQLVAGKDQGSQVEINEFASKVLQSVKQQAENPTISNDNLKSISTLALLQATQEKSANAPVQKPKLNTADSLQEKAINDQAALDKAGLSANGDKGTAITALSALNASSQNSDGSKGKTMSDVLLQNQQSAPLPNATTNASQGFDELLKVSEPQMQKYADANAKSKEVANQLRFGISTLVNKDARAISVQLYPKELGQVNIRMDISTETGKTHITMLAEKTETMNMLQKEATNIRSLLQDALKTDASNLAFSFHQGSDSNGQNASGHAFAKQVAPANSEQDVRLNLPDMQAIQHYQQMMMNDRVDVWV